MDKTQLIIRWLTAGAVGVIMIVAGAAITVAQDNPTQGPPPGRFGGPGGGRGGPFGGGPMGPGALLPRVPNVTDAQRDQLKSIADSHKAELQPLMEQLRTAQIALEDAIVASPVDEATIRLKSAEVANAEADMAVARAHVNAEVMAVLTPEQVKELQTRRDQMRQRRQNGPPARRQ